MTTKDNSVITISIIHSIKWLLRMWFPCSESSSVGYIGISKDKINLIM